MQDRSIRRSNPERSDATRSALIRAARQLFVTKGYANTSTPEVVEAAQVTRGALYHHFVDKAGLFMAVSLQAAHEVARTIEAQSKATRSPMAALERGAEAYFVAMASEGRARLLLLDAPAFLSPGQLLELSEAAGASQLKAGLQALMGDDSSPATALAALTDLLSAAFDRAALAIANGAAEDDYKQAIRVLLTGLPALPRPRARLRRG